MSNKKITIVIFRLKIVNTMYLLTNNTKKKIVVNQVLLLRTYCKSFLI